MRLLFLLFCLFIAMPAQASDAQKPVITVQTATLPNGAIIWLNHDPRLPIISMHMTFLNAGAIQDKPYKAGQTTLLSQLLTEGAGKRDSQAFHAALDNAGISLDFGADRDDFFGAVYTTKAQSDLAFSLLRDALNTPRLDGDDLNRLRAAGQARLQENMGMPDWKIARLTNAVVFAGHPYADNIGGTLQSLQNINTRDMQDALKAIQNPAQLRVSFAGDITLDQATTIIRQLTSDWQVRPMLPPPPAPGPDTFPATVTLHPIAIPQTFIAVIRPGLSHADPDFAAAQVMTHILGGGFGSRLTQTLREEKGLTYGINADMVERTAAPSFEITMSTKNETAGTSLDLIAKITHGMCAAPVSDAELTTAKSYLIHSLPMRFTSLDATTSQMNGMQAINLQPSYLTDSIAAIAAVTQTDVQRAANRVLCQDKSPSILLVGQPKGIKVDKTLTTLPGFAN